MLYCNSNNLTSLDLSQNTSLTELSIAFNSFTAVDISNNTLLSKFYCSHNNLSGLDVSQNINLTELGCEYNAINTLDLSQNTNLIQLTCHYNSIISLDVSQNTNLGNLTCHHNNISSLDVSQNTALYTLRCQNNDLTMLKSINTSTLVNLNATVNPNLTCVEVDDVAAANANLNYVIDATASYSTNCVILVSSITVQGQGGASTITTNGGTLQMEATVLPTNATDATYTWSITNGTGSASIDANGLLTALTNGTVTVTATANDGSGVTGDAVITISNQIVLVNSISVQGQGGASTITTNGGTLQMEATVLPANASDDTYTWSVANGTGSATIDANGLLTALTNGTVTW
ncbi:MAG: Ig-like domain-containing protein [Chitinophagales bacterium]